MVGFAIGVPPERLNFPCHLVNEDVPVTLPSAAVDGAGGAWCAPAPASDLAPSHGPNSTSTHVGTPRAKTLEKAPPHPSLVTPAKVKMAAATATMSPPPSAGGRERAERESSAGRRRDSRERRTRLKEPPSGDYLRKLLHRQERSAFAAVDATGESPEMYTHPRTPTVLEDSQVSSADMVASSGNRSRCATPALTTESPQSLPSPGSALMSDMAASTASVPSMVAPTLCSQEDAETQRRRTLFEIQRLMLEARPYDSIEFFHVQRELVKYLGLEPQRRASIADYLLAPGPPESLSPTQDIPRTGPCSPSAKLSDTLKNDVGGCGAATASKSFWKRLRTRLRRGGGCSDGGRSGAPVRPQGTADTQPATPPSKGAGDVALGV